jgi:Ca2+-transporting ATPase
VVGGVAFVPLQTLWINFTTQVFQAVGLGYGEHAEGLMKRKPRDPEGQILPTGLMLWLGCIGLVMGATTVGVIAWADHHYDTATARTMGMTSFAFANLLYSFCERDQLQSVLSLDVLRDRKFLYFSGASLLAIILAPQLDLLNRILGTVPLTLHQWLICLVAALTVVVTSEIRKVILRHREQAPAAAAGTVEAAPVTSPS